MDDKLQKWADTKSISLAYQICEEMCKLFGVEL